MQKVTKDVVLGFLEKPKNRLLTSAEYTPSKIGGDPVSNIFYSSSSHLCLFLRPGLLLKAFPLSSAQSVVLTCASCYKSIATSMMRQWTTTIACFISSPACQTNVLEHRVRLELLDASCHTLTRISILPRTKTLTRSTGRQIIS